MMKRAVALGFFDGVHIGHGALLRRTKALAERHDLAPCVMTYSQHPSAVLSKERVPLINTTNERILLISSLYGIDDVVIKDFTRQYASLSCEEFFEKILISELSCGYVIAGYDFRFGDGGAGDADALYALCKKNNIDCEIVDAIKRDGEAVSSSRVRKLLEEGDMEKARELLGHYHCTISPVIKGQTLGKKLGFATANQAFDETVKIPRRGVYLSQVTVGSRVFRGITNVGVRPTVLSSSEVFAETHILDFSGDLYGQTIKTEFVSFLREEKKFSSLDELHEQISQDVIRAREEI